MRNAAQGPAQGTRAEHIEPSPVHVPCAHIEPSPVCALLQKGEDEPLHLHGFLPAVEDIPQDD